MTDRQSANRSNLQRRVAAVVVADADGVGDVVDEDFAVADFAGAGGRRQSADDFVLARVGDDQLDLDFGQKVDLVFHAAIDFFVALLTAVAAHFA